MSSLPRFLVILAITSSLLLPTSAKAQANDPASVARALVTALNTGNQEAALALFADNATWTTAPDASLSGKAQIERHLQDAAIDITYLVPIGEPRVSGEKVTWIQDRSDEPLRKLGAAPARSSVELTVHGGQITALVDTIDGTSRQRIDAANATLNVRKALLSALNAGDANAVAALFAEDAIRITTTNDRQAGREAIRAAYQLAIDDHVRVDQLTYQVSGDRVVETFNVGFDSLRLLGVDRAIMSTDSIVRNGKVVVVRDSWSPETGLLLQTAINKSVAQASIRAINAHDIDAFVSTLAPDYVDHDPAAAADPTVEGTRAFFEMFFSAIPDLRYDVDTAISEGDLVMIHGTMTGTQTGELMGIPATGRAISFTATDILRIRGGRVAEHWSNSDELGLLTQLGVTPPMGGPPPSE